MAGNLAALDRLWWSEALAKPVRGFGVPLYSAVLWPKHPEGCSSGISKTHMLRWFCKSLLLSKSWANRAFLNACNRYALLVASRIELHRHGSTQPPWVLAGANAGA